MQSQSARSVLSSMILEENSDPVEFLAHGFLPLRVVLCQELLFALVVVEEGTWLLQEVALSLLLHRGQLVHVLARAVVLLRFRVAHGFPQSQRKSLRVRTVTLHPLVVLIEVVHALNGLKLCL